MLKVYVILILVMGFAASLSVVNMRLSPGTVRKGLGLLLLIGYTCVNIWVVLITRPVYERGLLLAPFQSYIRCFAIDEMGIHFVGPWLVTEILLNYLLYFPLGSLLPFIWPERFEGSREGDGALKVIPVGLAFSLAVEATQLLLDRGWMEFDDLFGNTLGTVLGYMLYRAFTCILPRCIERIHWLWERYSNRLNTYIYRHENAWSRTITEALLLIIISFLMTSIGFSDSHPYVMAILWLLATSAMVLRLGLAVAPDTWSFTCYLCSYVMKIILAIARLLNNHSIILARYGENPSIFWSIGVEYYRGFFNHFRSRYPFILNAQFHIFGINYACCMLVNILFTMLAVAIAFRALRYLELNGRAKCIGVLFAALLPYPCYVASDILREPIYILCLSTSLLLFIRYERSGKYLFLMATLAAVVPVISLHGGYFTVLLTYYVIGCAIAVRRLTIHRGIFIFVSAVLMTALFVLIVVIDPRNVLISLADPDELLELIGGRITDPGVLSAESAYLLSVRPHSWPQVILFLPIYMLYFLFSPLPTNWTRTVDVVTFAADSTFHLLFIALASAYLFRMRKTCDELSICRRTTVLVSLALVLSVAIVFCYATHNAGTAIRHRDVLYIIEAISISICVTRNDGIPLICRYT